MSDVLSFINFVGLSWARLGWDVGYEIKKEGKKEREKLIIDFFNLLLSGISIYIWTKLFLQNPDYRKSWWHMLPQFLLSCLLIMISSLFCEELYFLVGLYYLFHCMKQV